MSAESAARLSGPKWVVLAAWLLGALSLLLPLDLALVGFGRAIFWTLAIVHAIECAVFLPRLRRAPGPLASHLRRTFLFGILYVRELPPSQGAGGQAAGV
jgi:uncharacterized protein YhhL (DUF1145 family)